jgi:hypothetical protein
VRATVNVDPANVEMPLSPSDFRRVAGGAQHRDGSLQQLAHCGVSDALPATGSALDAMGALRSSR